VLAIGKVLIEPLIKLEVRSNQTVENELICLTKEVVKNMACVWAVYSTVIEQNFVGLQYPISN
jgi:hypothetical protein